MAKKATRAKPKKVQKKKAADRKPARQTSARRPSTRPKTPILPGMEDAVQDRELDSICSAIADNMHAINEAADTMKGLKGNGLSALRKKNRTVYKAHGVEIVRVPGDERLLARLVKSDGGDTGEDDADLDNGADEPMFSEDAAAD